MTDYLLGLDSGLTVTKAVMFRTDGSVVASAKREIPQIKERARHVERDMEAHWNASSEAIREALHLAAETEGREVQPLALSVAGHGDGVYLLDEQGRPLGLAATSLDSRAQQVVEGWDAKGVSARSLALTGQEPFPASPAAILAHIRDAEPRRFGQIAAIQSCKDWLRYCLTGEIATDFTEASVAFTDVRTQRYSDEALALFGLQDLTGALPPVIMPDAVAGHVSGKAARMTGLRAGLPVAAGLHDVTACAVGSGVIAPGTIAVIAGTYSINEMLMDRPETSAGWYARNGLMPGQWMNMSISPASSANLDWFLRQSARDALAQGDPFRELQRELDAVAGDPSDIVYLPYLFGSPHRADVAGAFLGLRGWHHRGHMLRAVAEGIVFNHRHHVDLLDPDHRTDRVRLTGGSSRNPYFCQLFADALDRRIEIPATQEAGALGVAICAGLACGAYDDWSDAIICTQSDARIFEPGAGKAQVEDAWQRYQRVAAAMVRLEERQANE